MTFCLRRNSLRVLVLVPGQRHRRWPAISSLLHCTATLHNDGDALPSRWMPPLGFVPISPPQEGDTEILPKIVPVATHVPHLQETQLVLPPQHTQTLPGALKESTQVQERTRGFPGGLGIQGKDRRGQGSWDRMVGKRGGSALSCAANASCSPAFGEGETWGRTAAVGMRCCLGHISSLRNGSQGAVCLGSWFVEGFSSTQKKQTQASQPMLCYRTKPSGLAWLASHKGSIKLYIKMLPFISAW